MKFIYIIIFLLLVFKNFNASATGPAKVTLTGKITDKETNEAIAGATIYIPDLKTGAISDSLGKYKIENLPAIKILIQVSFIGYKTIVENVNLNAITVKNFILEQSVTEVNEVVVTGSSAATEIKRSSVPLAVLDSKNLIQSLNTNIIDAIAKIPGINAVTTGPNISKPFIHGLGYNRVLTLYDGVRQEGQQWGDEHGVEVDENSIDKIEVIKGPASLTYGSDAIAGVVNLIPAPPLPDGTSKGNAIFDYQTNNGLLMGSASYSENDHGIIRGAMISHKEATNYQNPVDGRVYGTAFNETDASGFIGINRHWGYSHLNFSVYDDLQEIPDGSRDSTTRKFTRQISEIDTFRPIVSGSELNSYKIATLHQHVQHYRVYSSNNFIMGESKLSVTLGYQQNDRQEFSHPQAPEIPGLDLVLNTFTYDIKYYLPEFDGWKTTIGLNGMYQLNENKGTEFIIPGYNQFDAGPFALIKKTFNKLDISAGMRFDSRFFRNNDMYTILNSKTGFDMQVKPPDTTGANHTFYYLKRTFTGFSGSMGASYDITRNIIIKANIARGFRAPNISEISANGVHPGTDIFQIGNPGFKPEFSLQEDMGIFYSSSHINGSFEVYNNNISNYIFNQKVLNHLGNDSVIIHGNETFKFQQSQAQLYGGEASLDIHPHPVEWLHFENSVSLVYALNKGGNGTHITDSSKYLPFIPPLHTNSEVRANIKKKFKHFSSLYVKVDMEYYAGQNRVYLADNTETVTAGYTLFDCGAGADLTNSKGKVIMSFNIAGNNITNVAYQSHLSRLKYMEQYPVNWTGRSGIYNMGRNISFKIIVPLYFKNS